MTFKKKTKNAQPETTRSETVDDAQIAALQARIEHAKTQLAVEHNTYPLATVVPNRPSTPTTRVIRAFLAFLDVLEKDGANVELMINSTPVAMPLSLSGDFYRKMLSPQGNRGIAYNGTDRISLVSQAKAPIEAMLLKHESEIMSIGQPRYGMIGNVQPSGPTPWTIPARGYIVSGVEEQHYDYSKPYEAHVETPIREHIEDEP